MSQFMRPDGDRTQDGDWVPEPSDTNLWDVIDEAEANDADYAWINAVGSGESFWVTLSNPSGTPGSGTGTVRVRAKKIEGATTVKIHIYVQEDLVTIYDETHADAITTDFVTYVYTVPSVNMGNVTVWADVELLIKMEVSGGGKGSDPAISWVEFEVPDAAAPSAFIPRIIGPF